MREIDAEVVQYRESDIFRKFPQNYEPMTQVAYQPRAFVPSVEQVEPFYVCDRRLYFATASTDRVLLRATAVSDTFVNDVIQHSRARSTVLILDCCHSGAFAKGLAARCRR